MANPGFTCSSRYFGFRVYTWNLPSGYTCPGALTCLAYRHRVTRKVTPGRHRTLRCYSVEMERFPAVADKAWANLDLLAGPNSPSDASGMADLIDCLWPRKATHVRIHAGGDFWSQAYFDAWIELARRHPDVTMWAFTKSLPFWIARLGDIPPNLTLQASYGSKHDDLIEAHGLKSARVVDSADEAAALGLPVDHNDALAMTGSASFALLENFAAARNRRKTSGVTT